VLDDSDDMAETNFVSSKKKHATYRSSSPALESQAVSRSEFYLLRVPSVLVIFSATGRGKKARVAVPLSDDDEEESANVTAFSNRLTQYKKAPSSASSHESPTIRSYK
jgi:hypothetical protein